jgi:beta-lactamase superfamily II metal-dependent hydrolase
MGNNRIKLFSVGNADAILIKYHILGLEFIILVDAGNKNDSGIIIDYIDKYTRNKRIDLAILTHPHSDHIGGFFDIVNNIDINEFWIHDLQSHINNIIRKDEFESRLVVYGDLFKRINGKELKYLTETIDNSNNLIDLLRRKRIKIKEPFLNLNHELIPIKILGPTVYYYENLLHGFKDMERVFEEENLREQYLIEDITVQESLSDTLDEVNDESYENNSSVIFNFYYKNSNFIFTGDAGPEALQKSINNFNLSNIDLLKVPHRGSKRNLTTKIIKTLHPKVACISAKGTRKYPSRAIINALEKIDCKIYYTKEKDIDLEF